MQIFNTDIFGKLCELFLCRQASPVIAPILQVITTCCCDCSILTARPVSTPDASPSRHQDTNALVADNDSIVRNNAEVAASGQSNGASSQEDRTTSEAHGGHGQAVEAVCEAENSTDYKDVELEQDDFEGDGTIDDDGQDNAEDGSTYWTPEQLQEIRDSRYQKFCGEDETDYTKGPSRIVVATDGVEEVTALLLTLPLSQAVQKAVKAERAYNKTREASTAKIAALNRFKHLIQAEVRNHKHHIASLEDSNDESHLTKKLGLEDELENLEAMLEEYTLTRVAAENDLTWRGHKLRQVFAQLTIILEDSWIDAQLLEQDQAEPETTFPEYDLQEEYGVFMAKMQDLENHLAERPALDTSRDHMALGDTHVDQASVEESRRLHDAICDAQDRVEAAQAAFDWRDHGRVEAQQARVATIEQGGQPEDDTSDAFDVRWHQHEREITRELIEAEAELDEAQQAAAAHIANEPAPAEDEEGFELLGDNDSGYAAWLEPRPAGFEPTPRIEEWLATLPDESLPYPDPAEHDTERGTPDAWDAEELAFGEGISTIESNQERNKSNRFRAQIAEWQQIQRELAAEFGRTEQ